MKKAISVFAVVLLLLTVSTSVFAMDFTPSVEVKTAPEVPTVIVGGKECNMTIEENGEVVEGVKMYDKNGSDDILELYLISAAEKDDAIIPEAKERLEKAEEVVAEAESFNDLEDGLEDQLFTQVQVFTETSGRTVKMEDLVISDLFDATLIRNKMQEEKIPEGQSCTFRLKPSADLTPDDFVALLNCDEEGRWTVVDIEWTEDGYMKVTVQSLFIFAFVVERSGDLPVDPHGPDSPQTGEVQKIRMEYMAVAAVFVGIAGVFFVKAKKHQEV